MQLYYFRDGIKAKHIHFSKGQRVGPATIDQDSQNTSLKSFYYYLLHSAPPPQKSYFEERGILEEEAKTENL